MLNLRILLLTLSSLLLSINANAEFVFESAQGDFDSSGCCAGSLISSNSFIGSVFKLDEITKIDGIGGHFNNLPRYPDAAVFSGLQGTIFGALVSVDGSDLPVGTLTNIDNILAFSVFTPNSGFDTFIPVSTTLTPGSYAIVFGSGLFGATGKTLLTLVQYGVAHTSDGGSVYLNDDNIPVWTSFEENVGRYRMFVTGTAISAVPEPETYAMMLAGLGLINLFNRRKVKKLLLETKDVHQL